MNNQSILRRLDHTNCGLKMQLLPLWSFDVHYNFVVLLVRG